jgi:BirA family transcriptional regulator, biotin operon repressor / biotin---[acetyl-CoA-carboxylase] ligase
MTMARDIRVFAEIDSTNKWLRELSGSGDVGHGTVAIADVQTAGRGRLDRKWVAPTGSALLMSVLVDTTAASLDVERWPLVSFCMALAVCETANEYGTGTGKVSLKWPNDVIVCGDVDCSTYRKLAGILVEVASTKLIVGVGINLNRPDQTDPMLPADAKPVWLNELCAGSTPVDRMEFCESVLARFDTNMAELALGTEALVGRYRKMLSTLQRTVGIEIRSGSFEADALDIDSLGRLVVRTTDGVRTIDASEVTHIRPR